MLAAPVPVVHHHRPGCHTVACDHRADRAWAQHHPPTHPGLASWYDDAGPKACPWAVPRNEVAVAMLIVPCGEHVRICYAGCVVATVDDHGPYIPGRVIDLNARAKQAISCTDLCPVRYTVVR